MQTKVKLPLKKHSIRRAEETRVDQFITAQNLQGQDFKKQDKER